MPVASCPADLSRAVVAPDTPHCPRYEGSSNRALKELVEAGTVQQAGRTITF